MLALLAGLPCDLYCHRIHKERKRKRGAGSLVMGGVTLNSRSS